MKMHMFICLIRVIYFMSKILPVQFFKDLADDTRLKIILLLQLENELCVCELTVALGLSQPKISRHIAQLKSHQLLSERKVGRWTFYRLADVLPHWQREVIGLSCTNNQEYIEQCISCLNAMGNRPNRQQECCE
jgi:ArsR family transcriptional regulator